MTMETTRALLQRVATQLDLTFNGSTRVEDRKIGFVLLTFPYNSESVENPRTNYLSNGADRKEMVVLFKEMIARFEGQPEPPTGHG